MRGADEETRGFQCSQSEFTADSGENDDETAGVWDGRLSGAPFPPLEETHRLVRAFIRIRKPEVRDRLLSMVERVSNE